LERKGWLPYLVSTVGSGDNIRYCTEWMEHDNVEFGTALTNLAAAWYRARNLKKVEWGNWTGTNNNITALNSIFEQCISIEKIDLSSWDTANWHVTNISNLFSYCVNLKICIVPFNTVNWGNGSGKTLDMHYAWGNCISLE
jgi:surface protein